MTAELPVGSRVIAVPSPKASVDTKKQQLKRASDTFGEANVIESAEDCDEGHINKKQKITTSKGTTLIRDICEEKR